MASEDNISTETRPPFLFLRDYTADEYSAAEGLLMLAFSGGGLCLWPSSSTSISISTPPTASATANAVGKIQDTPQSMAGNLFPHMCNLCGQTFRSHQALGGHKTRHRVRPATAAVGCSSRSATLSVSTSGRVHECSICHEEFPSGHALGGHKRKHFEEIISGGARKSCKTSSSGSPGDNSGVTVEEDGGHASTRKDYDLNLPYTFYE